MKIDLGSTFGGDGDDDEDDAAPLPVKKKSRTLYPSLHLFDVDEEALELPDEGTATIRYRVTARTQSEGEDFNGKKRSGSSMTLEVQSLETKGPDLFKETAKEAIGRWSRKGETA